MTQASFAPHILDPILPAEIEATAAVVNKAHAGKQLIYNAIDMNEPVKAEVLAILDAERKGKPIPAYVRTTKAYFQIQGINRYYKAIVDPVAGQILKIETLKEGVQTPFNVDEMAEIELICLKHPVVLAEIEKLKLPKEYVVRIDPWIYATDDPDEKRGLIQMYMYIALASHDEANHYSLPLKFSPVFDRSTQEFVRMDYLASGVDSKVSASLPWVPKQAVEYTPELSGESPREGLKPYTVQQPEGPSFQVDGNRIRWQKWDFRLGFNYREGAFVYGVSFDGRDVFYRISCSEMTVPYGDPRFPYHRKQAFDLGDVGFGVSANCLKLGCDCLGYIKYFDGYISNKHGKPLLKESAICLHEQDGGLLFKHTNYRNNKAIVARRRQLVIQTIATVANYEYILEYIFDQAGGIDLQIRATGILSTMPIDDVITVPWGTVVGDGVMAAHHQHLIAFRIDPSIDGSKNSLMVQETHELPDDDNNPYGNGYVTKETFFEQAGYADFDVDSHREFKIVNESIINKVSKKPIGYKVVIPPAQMLLCKDRAFNKKRACFATHPIWVTKYEDGRLHAAGEFTNQSQDDEGLKVWANSAEKTRNEDIVIWATMSITHIPRTEDFPVMPVEIHTIHLKPAGFFEKNPALDIPQATQQFNKSVLVDGMSKLSCCDK